MPKRVLVVDDDLPTVDLIRGALECEGFQVAVAHDGASCLLAIGSQRPDLLVLDVVMPVMDGFRTLRALREVPQTKCLPVILLTSLSDQGSVSRGWTRGVDFYLTKPFETADLILAVKRMLEAGACEGWGEDPRSAGDRSLQALPPKLRDPAAKAGGRANERPRGGSDLAGQEASRRDRTR